MTPTDCNQNTDPNKLVRDGTGQTQRFPAALDPASAPVDQRTAAHALVFAQAYAAYLRYYNAQNNPVDTWQPFFRSDVSAQLAVAAIQDVDDYKAYVKSKFDYLNHHSHAAGHDDDLRTNLGDLFSTLGSLARQLDALKDSLPADQPLKATLQNLIRNQLAMPFRRLIASYRAGQARILVKLAPPPADLRILGEGMITFDAVLNAAFSRDWVIDPGSGTGGGSTDWATYWNGITAAEADALYGPPGALTVFEPVNGIVTHNLFTSIFDLFLRAYARLVNDANAALEATFQWDGHQPHYAVFLAFLRLFDHARAEINILTGRHLDFYYRDILRLKEKSAQPGHVHLLLELARQVPEHLVAAGALFKAGKDDHKVDAFYANDRDFVANQAKVAALKTVYRHHSESGEKVVNADERLFASPVANSDDGLGAKLTTPDQSWHPFFNEVYQDGVLSEIRMPQAEIGFAIASHYLWMAEGTRTITLDIATIATRNTPATARTIPPGVEDVTCLLTSDRGWLEVKASEFTIEPPKVHLVVKLTGVDPAITPYVPKTHGYAFDTGTPSLPVLLVKLKHRDDALYVYPLLEHTTIQQIDLTVDVGEDGKLTGLRTLAVSNEFGPVDTSKPFQPFGPSPRADSALVIGSKELFQKNPAKASLDIGWAASQNKKLPSMNVDYLNAGAWKRSNIKPLAVGGSPLELGTLPHKDVGVPDLTGNNFYAVSERSGFLRLVLDGDIGQDTYQAALIDYLIDKSKNPPPKDVAANPGTPPVAPTMTSLVANYTADQGIDLSSNDATVFAVRQARYFHVAPYGQAEQHRFLNGSSPIYLVPQFSSEGVDDQGQTVVKGDEGEFYIGISGLKPPQNLALLFQLVDGTANPRSVKPPRHVHWSYLRRNQWVAFTDNLVEDHTDGLINSGILTLAVPDDATDDNSLLPPGMHWIRAAVYSQTDAVCRLVLVAAQALEATFTDRSNDPAFSAKVLPPATISKLDPPDAEVKKITQPFASIGGRGAEAAPAFYTRVSERLRHKDRGIALWDYERLILEAFPQIHRVKCLNHTQYDPDPTGLETYKELAPGHVTVVTIPNTPPQELRDPLRPYTSLGLLKDIDAFLAQHLSCFVTRHVHNPQFEEVQVAFGVRFYDGFDATFYKAKLRQEITRFLSPWAFPGGGNPSFGGKIYKSVLVKFVEERPYVDYVVDFKLLRKGDTHDLAEVEGSMAVSILVSVPADQHLVNLITPAAQAPLGEDCPCEA